MKYVFGLHLSPLCFSPLTQRTAYTKTNTLKKIMFLRTALSSTRRFASSHGTAFFFGERYSGLKTQPAKAAMYSYNSALIAAAACDGMDEREEQYVLGLGELHGLDAAEVTRGLQQDWTDDKIEATLKAFCSNIKDDALKGYLIYDCVLACSADLNYSREERAKVRKIASIVGVGEDYVASIERYAFLFFFSKHVVY